MSWLHIQTSIRAGEVRLLSRCRYLLALRKGYELSTCTNVAYSDEGQMLDDED